MNLIAIAGKVGLWATVAFVLMETYSAAATVCGSCHPNETAGFVNSAMGQSISPPWAKTPPGTVNHSESGSVVHIAWENGRLINRLSELGLEAKYSIDYQIGAGKIGHSYLTRVGDYLLESPVSYYRQFGWDVSPGFKEMAVLDFDRVVGDRCLFCHTGSSELVGKRRLAEGMKVEAITCSRCHGDTRRHLAAPSRENIVNPARLPVRARDSVCEQCHLEGVASILNPGKRWQDFHAGEDLETTFSVYVGDEARPGAKVVSQVEQLAQSRCARESGGKLWCGTCHDPHPIKPVDRASGIAAICKSCHQQLTPAHPGSVSNCTSCHMPRLSPNDIAHAASTDHRILARPTKPMEQKISGSLHPWHEGPAIVAQRNLGLAELAASALPGMQPLGEAAGRVLEMLPTDQRENDAAALAGLGDVDLAEGRTGDSQLLFQRAFELAPNVGEYALYSGIALKRKSALIDAEQALIKAIAADPSLQRAYMELSTLYSKQGDPRKAADVLREYLKWNPQSILVRSSLEILH